MTVGNQLFYLSERIDRVKSAEKNLSVERRAWRRHGIISEYGCQNMLYSPTYNRREINLLSSYLRLGISNDIKIVFVPVRNTDYLPSLIHLLIAVPHSRKIF